jgi:hypothetical protein
MRRPLIAARAGGPLVVALLAGAVLASPAPAMPVAHIAAKKITRNGVGQVKLGMTFAELREKRLVGRLRPGCELAENTRTARLRSPLRGNVNFTQSTPRKVTDIAVTRGGKARGVGIGDRIRDIRDAFPRAIVDHSTEDVFGITLVRIPRNGGGRIQFSVPLDTRRIDLIAVPFIAFCE